MNIDWSYTFGEITVKDQGAHTDAVVVVRWVADGIDEEGNTAPYNGTTFLNAMEVPVSDFISLNDLNDEIVLGWVHAAMDEMQELQMRMHFKNAVAQKASRTIKAPWHVPDVVETVVEDS